jgi:hypothetical protein
VSGLPNLRVLKGEKVQERSRLAVAGWLGSLGKTLQGGELDERMW